MSRINPEAVVIGYRDGGVDSGKIDYSVKVQTIRRMSKKDFEDLISALDEVKNCVTFDWKREALAQGIEHDFTSSPGHEKRVEDAEAETKLSH